VAKFFLYLIERQSSCQFVQKKKSLVKIVTVYDSIVISTFLITFFLGNRSGLHLLDVLMTSLVSSLFVLVHAVLCSYAAVMADWTRKTSVHKHTRWEIHSNTTCFTTSMHWLKLFTWLVCSYTLLILLLASWNYHLMRSRSFAVCSASRYFSFVVMFAWSPELLHHAGKAATAMQSLWLYAHG